MISSELFIDGVVLDSWIQSKILRFNPKKIPLRDFLVKLGLERFSKKARLLE